MEVEEEDEILTGAHFLQILFGPNLRIILISEMCRYRDVSTTGGVQILHSWIDTILFGKLCFQITEDYLEIFPDSHFMRVSLNRLPPPFLDLVRFASNQLSFVSWDTFVDRELLEISLDRMGMLRDVFANAILESQNWAQVEVVRTFIDLAIGNHLILIQEKLPDIRLEILNNCRNLAEYTQLGGVPFDWQRVAKEVDSTTVQFIKSQAESIIIHKNVRVEELRPLPSPPPNDGSVESAQRYLEYVQEVQRIERGDPKVNRINAVAPEAVRTATTILTDMEKLQTLLSYYDFLLSERDLIRRADSPHEMRKRFLESSCFHLK
jgi:hypothetical protein